MVDIGISSAASNTNTKYSSEDIKKRNSNVIDWEYGELIIANDFKLISCRCSVMCI